jgi:hypothetical protein
MAKSKQKTADPLQFLVENPFCAFPDMRTVIGGLGLKGRELEKLLMAVHGFEHALLSAGYEVYSTVGRKNGAKVLDGAISVLAKEYPKWVNDK